MADFRRMLYAFAVVALLAGLAVPASAQVTSCIGQPVFTPVRAEGYTEQTGDLIITCTGGNATGVGNTVQGVTVTLYMSTQITSKITDSSTNPMFNEALLLVDEPGTVFNLANPTSGHPLLNCGNGGLAPYDVNSVGVCNIIVASGNPADTYNGTSGHPNVFQGRQVNNSNGSVIQFVQVPFDPPGPTNGIGAVPTRTLRITNIRGNVAALGVSGSGSFSLGATVSASVTFSPSNSIAANITNIPVAVIRTGLLAAAAADKRGDVAPFLQCTADKGAATNDIVVTEGPGMQTAFRVRNFIQLFRNGSYNGNSDWNFNGALNPSFVPFYDPNLDISQNAPGVFYGSEGGFLGGPSDASLGTVPAGIGGGFSNVPPGNVPFSNPNGIFTAGKVTQGTRIAVKFGAPPPGSNPTVPAFVWLFNAINSSGCKIPGTLSPSTPVVTCRATGMMVLVTGSDANGAGGSVPIFGTGAQSAVAIPAAGATMVWEVVFSNPAAQEYAVISASVSPTVSLTSSPSTPDTTTALTANVGFAPFYDAGPASLAQPDTTPFGSALVTSSNGLVALPIPRFTSANSNASPLTVYQYSKCACDMLFPWVVGDSTFTTSIVIDNTSLDPCNGVSAAKGCVTPQFGAAGGGLTAAPQSGLVTFWYYGTKDISLDPSQTGTFAPQTTSVAIPAGSYVAHIVSNGAAGDTPANGLKRLAGPFAGYVIAQAQFQYCHGIAAIGANVPGFGTQTYLGLILDGFTGNGTGRNGLTTEKLNN